MPLATLLISLHFFQATMTSTNTPKGPPASRGGHRRITMLRIPGPSTPDGADDNVRTVHPAGIGDVAESVQQDERFGAHAGDLPNVPSPPAPENEEKSENRATFPQGVSSEFMDGSQRDLQIAGNRSDVADIQNVSPGNLSPVQPSSSITLSDQSTAENIEQQAVAGLQETEIVPVLKRKDSPRNKMRSSSSSSKTVSVSEPIESATDSAILRVDSRTSSLSSTISDSYDESRTIEDPSTTAIPQTPAMAKRRISFPADSVLTAVIQDGDTAELLRILTGRHGPGLVQRRGEGGVMRGVDVCQSNHVGLTALHHAVLANNLDAAKLLLCYGADVNAQDVHGFSPLHTAAACGFLPLTSLLLLFGADVFSQTLEHELPIDVAKELRIVRVLSAEMTRLVHQELWVTSLVRAQAEEAWLLLRKLLACVLLFVLHVCGCVRTLWRKRHRKAD